MFQGTPDGNVTVNGNPLPMSKRAREKSPTGFSWGYGGSGPYALAHSILTHLYTDEAADAHAQDFKWQVIGHLPYGEPFALTYEQVQVWMKDKPLPLRHIRLGETAFTRFSDQDLATAALIQGKDVDLCLRAWEKIQQAEDAQQIDGYDEIYAEATYEEAISLVKAVCGDTFDGNIVLEENLLIALDLLDPYPGHTAHEEGTA